MILTEKVIINCNARSYKRYINLGYAAEINKPLEVLVKDLPKHSRVKITYQCDDCGGIFVSGFHCGGVICSRCAIIRTAKSEKYIALRSGPLNTRYNPNITEEEREKGRFYPEYGEWRSIVYRIFKYTCQVCLDKRGGNLIAHHLNGWHWDKENRFVPYNGVCICKDCHNKFHKQFGFMFNTREQFIDYLTENIYERNNNPISEVFYNL